MNKKEIAALAVKGLEEIYPNAECSLVYDRGKPYELMIAGRLSAQCTDKRVNIVTKELFERYKTLSDFAGADINEVAEIVKPCGLYKTKAESIVLMARELIDRYEGKIPETVEELTKLPGIGRKTANLIMGDIHKKPAVVADTHFIRITGRLGLTLNTDPVKVEADLIKLIPAGKSSDFCHRVVLFGRDYCSARKPKCDLCPLSRYFQEHNKGEKPFKCRV